MLFVGILLLELLLLFFLSQLVSRNLALLLYRLTRSQSVSIHLLSFLFLPGVVIHELSHLLVANILFVQTGEIEFFPKLHGSSLKLGSVEVAQTDPIRRAIIGFAPVLVGTTLLLLSLFAFSNGFGSTISLGVRLTVLLFVVFEIGNTMFSSRKDVEGTLELLLVLAVFAVVAFVLGVRIPSQWIQFFSEESVIKTLWQIDLFLCVPLFMNLFLIAALKLLLKRR